MSKLSPGLAIARIAGRSVMCAALSLAAAVLLAPSAPAQTPFTQAPPLPIPIHGGLNFTAYSKTATTALQEVGELVRGELAG